MMSYGAKVQEAAKYIRRRCHAAPRAGIVLGTGLGGLADQMTQHVAIDYRQIPNFPQATALGHAGRLICGTVAGQNVVTLDGRLHAYEGHSHRQLALPIHVMKQLGVEILILSNASGGVHPRLASGDVVVINDHVNLMWDNPFIGSNDPQRTPQLCRIPPTSDTPRLSDIPRRPDTLRSFDVSAPYDKELIRQALEIARRKDFVATTGVYAGMTGPNYETRAEYRFLRRIGVDVVGMSTVPEVIAAVDAEIRVLALSVVTNVCRPDRLLATSGLEVLAIAESTQPKMRDIVTGILEQL